MRLGIVIRTQPAIWLLPALLVLGVMYVAGYQAATIDPYPVALSAAGEVVIGFIAPICAALAVWEARRLRAGGVWGGPHVRSHAAIASMAIAPVVATGTLIVTASMAAKLAFAGVFPVPDWRITALVIIVLAAHSTLGFGLGFRMPVLVALPAALLAVFLWMAFPRAIEPLWIRHLTGSLECCRLQDQLAIEALLGAATFAGGVLAAGVLLAKPRARRATRLLVAGVTLSLVVLASGLVGGLGPYAVAPRSSAQLRCMNESPVTVCVWPEHISRLGEVTALARSASSAWAVEGIVRRMFAEDGGEAGTGRLDFTLQANRGDLIVSLAATLLPPFPSCAETEPYPAIDAYEPTLAWLSALGGLTDAESRTRYGAVVVLGQPAPFDTVVALRSSVPEVRRAWLDQNLAALARCNAEPAPIPR